MADPITVRTGGGRRTAVASALRDPSTWALILSNTLTIALALDQQWSLIRLLWVYWFQSVIIGVVNFARLLELENFSTESLRINDRAVARTKATLTEAASFFALHYGMFHVVYAVFLGVGYVLGLSGDLPGLGVGRVPSSSLIYPALAVVGFGVNHVFSFLHYRDELWGANVATVMFRPYARILPMHLTIILAAFLGHAALPFFLVLKAFADVAMHVREHGKAAPGAEGDRDWAAAPGSDA